ncbi:MAG TPA: YqaE/Pmp3 family membrane protein [Chloroflexota bacterium]|nr:YqaE/Pmp3 family membrane protein [Chloroflexota bacterium]
MLYLVAILLPPLALLLVGKPFQAILALILQVTVLGWLPAAIWALFVVNTHHADKRANKLIRAMERERRARRS